MADIEALLAPVSPEAPSGELLEYDAAFQRVHEAATGKPEQRMGASVIPASPPDWRKVETDATALFARTKDLRVAVLWVKARLHNAGFAGFCEGLGVMRALLERFWDTVHPQLDPSDGNDPVMRVNAISALADGGVLLPLRDAEVASARAIGRISVRDLDPAARQEKPPPAEGEGAEGAQPPQRPPPVDAVLTACDREALAKTAGLARAALDDLSAMDALVAERTGGERIANLSRLKGVVELVAKTLSDRIARDAGASGQDGAQAGDGVTQGDGSSAGGVSIGAIRSREDVVLALDQICAYYERAEPSSPIPLLLKRSKRLVAMSFLDIVRDLVPDAAANVEALRGKEQ